MALPSLICVRRQSSSFFSVSVRSLGKVNPVGGRDWKAWYVAKRL